MKRFLLFSFLTLFFATTFNISFSQERESIKSQLRAQYPGSFVVYYDSYGGYYGVKLNYGQPNVTEGAFDVNGKMVIPLNKYSYMCKHDGYYGVKIGEKAGACDLNGNEIVPCKFYSVITGSTSGVMRVKDSESGSYYDYVPDGSAVSQSGTFTKENESIKAQLKSRYPGAMVVYHSGKVGYYGIIYNYGKPDVIEGACDLNGNEIIAPNRYSNVTRQDSYGGYFTVKIGDKEGVCDLTGREIIAPNKYSNIVLHGEFYGVWMGDKKGACDLNGNEIVPCKFYSVITGSTNDVMGVKDSESGSFYDYFLNGSAVSPRTDATVAVLKEDPSIKAQLKSRYPGAMIVYHDGGGGWYGIILNYGSSSQKEGACDLAGNEIIAPNRYSSVVRHNSYGGYFTVKIGEKEGACDLNGKQIVPCEFANVFCSGNKMLVQKTKAQKDYAYCEYYAPTYAYASATPPVEQPSFSSVSSASPVLDNSLYTVYAKDYVEKRINKWQVKDEFETTAAYKARVNDTTREALIAKLAKEAEVEFINQAKKQFKQRFVISTYDADNESFMFNSPDGDYVIKVPGIEARAFKENFKYNIDKSVFAVVDNKAKLAKLVVESGSKYYQSADIEYAQVKVDYNFAPIQIDDQSTQTVVANKPTIQQTSVSVGTVSDVDRDIPVNNTVNDKTFAVVIANETYQKESQVQFAVNDGKIFAEYCKKTLGLPAKNVHLVENATLNNIKFEINWLKQVISAYEGDAKVLFYYAGHGIPDETQRTAYLLPVDGYGSDVTTGFSLDELYGALGTLPSKSVTIMLDACFSGAKRDGGMMAAARGIAIKFKPGQPIGNTVVFSASQNDETAYPHKEKGHGLFTYYLLKKLKESKGAVSYEDLSSYITDNVRQQSIVLNSKSQTPTTISSPVVDQQWKGWTLR